MFATDFSHCDVAQTLSAAVVAHERQRQGELDLILLAQHYADLHPSRATVRDDGLPGGEQTRVYGGEGCPEITEFAAAEFGAVTGRSAGSAAVFIGRAVALRERFPQTWKRVKSGHATGWKACLMAQDCVTLSFEAAAIVDRRVADIIDSVTGQQLRKIIKAASWDADPDAAKAKAEEKAKERGVWVGRTDDHGTTTLFVKAATGDIIQLNATITQLANALAALGDTTSRDQRRAKAAGLLSDPELAADLLAAAHHLATTDSATGQTDPDNRRDLLEDATTPDVASGSSTRRVPDRVIRTDARGDEDSLLDDLAEPGPDDEADRDTPHPDTPDHPLDQDRPLATPGDPPGERRPMLRRALGSGESPAPVDGPARPGMDTAARLELRRKINATRCDHPNQGRRTYQTVVNLHITDQTLLAGEGTARVEGYGPAYTDRLEELLGHHRIVLRPVIDLNQAISVHAYEIPTRIRDHINQRYPVEQFPYGSGETTNSTDLDHLQPYQPENPTAQTNTENLAPLRRFSHRLKTHGDWEVRRIDAHTLEWISPHGYQFHVDHNGTHPAPTRNRLRDG
ncbi:hypothetical protein F1D05_17525 [Kribbella qitaiheensis]|uniref:DUF222 domain-containing protein n=1 Tax=Kribbella qitaiheensis TaxID=1544730 RepID=A0A7G6WZH2_9ACTN|nr:hypothetical protein [Kribbella qitaiheensis]QNE19387.1 hypothetical protein F1D05_17525 [Kribbella qitaiheensis]